MQRRTVILEPEEQLAFNTGHVNECVRLWEIQFALGSIAWLGLKVQNSCRIIYNVKRVASVFSDIAQQ